MSCKHVLFACTVVLYGTCALTAENLSKELNTVWKDKVFVLEKCCAKELTFSEQGELLNATHGNLTPSAVLVKSVKLKKADLEVRAERVNFASVSLGPDIGSAGREGLRVTIKFGEAPDTSDKLNAALQMVFVRAASNADLFPAYMQACARGQILKYQGLWRCELAGVWSRQEDLEKAQNISEKEAVPREVLDFRMVDGRYVAERGPVYRVGKAVTPPKAVVDPDPEYSEAARQKKVNAVMALRVVVSVQGNPEHIQVIAPAGYGLDERAVAAVSHWRFQPATYQGQPVAVAVTVEVNFRLY